MIALLLLDVKTGSLLLDESGVDVGAAGGCLLMIPVVFFVFVLLLAPFESDEELRVFSNGFEVLSFGWR